MNTISKEQLGIMIEKLEKDIEYENHMYETAQAFQTESAQFYRALENARTKIEMMYNQLDSLKKSYSECVSIDTPSKTTLLTNEEVREGFEKEFPRNPMGGFQYTYRDGGATDRKNILNWFLAQRSADLKWVEKVVIGENQKCFRAKLCEFGCPIVQQNALRDSQRALLPGIK